MKSYLKLLRVKHYIKNSLVMFPLFFGQQFTDPVKMKSALLGVFAFCMISSVIYIINDIRDVEKDRQHPTKKFRPIASGEVPVPNALGAAAVCFVLSIIFTLLAGSSSALLLLLLYFVLNLGYSMGLKNVPLVDVAILTSGFLIRVLYGAALTGIEVSNWLYMTVTTGAFFMGLGKRRNEFQRQSGNDTRAVLKLYSYDFLDKNMYVCVALCDTFYSLWAMSHANDRMIWTVPVFILILMRYSLDIEGNSDGDPVEVIEHDVFLVGLVLVYGLVLLGLLYLF